MAFFDRFDKYHYNIGELPKMPNIQDVRAINSPQKVYMWEVDIVGLSSGSIQNMSFYAKTATIPQSAVEPMVINHKSQPVYHAGRDASGHTLPLTFWDDESQTISNFFNDWHDNLILDPVTGGGLHKNLYTADVFIRLKNSADDTVTAEWKLTRAFPIDNADVTLSYDASDAIEWSVTLQFDTKIKVR